MISINLYNDILIQIYLSTLLFNIYVPPSHLSPLEEYLPVFCDYAMV